MAQSIQLLGRSPGTLRVAVLAALVEAPAHGYALTNRIARRLSGLVHADPRRVYETLLELEREELATSAEEETSPGAGRTRRVFSATEKAIALHASWLGEPEHAQLAHANIRALLVFSTPEHAPQLLRLLEEYEIDCMEVQESTGEGELRGGSWGTRIIAAERARLAEQLRAEIRWVARARREIEEYVGGER